MIADLEAEYREIERGIKRWIKENSLHPAVAIFNMSNKISQTYEYSPDTIDAIVEMQLFASKMIFDAMDAATWLGLPDQHFDTWQCAIAGVTELYES
ncbi:MAG: hypothetical protein ACPG7F_19740 [Aggregatilineales bacterium]